MAKNKPEVVETTEAEVEETETQVEETETQVEEKSSKTEVTVTWRGNSRVFSKEIHGDDFKKVAKQFAEKFEGTIV